MLVRLIDAMVNDRHRTLPDGKRSFATYKELAVDGRRTGEVEVMLSEEQAEELWKWLGFALYGLKQTVEKR